MSNSKKKIVVAISGGGRTLSNLLADPELTEAIVGVISSNTTCKGLKVAQSYGLPIFVGDFTHADKEKLADDLYSWVNSLGADLIVLAGFLKKIPIKSEWSNRIINIHPALLPKFGGKGMYGERVHSAVLEAKEMLSGATVHFVTDVYDEGAIIAQSHVNVRSDETVESLARKVFESECAMYPDVIKKIISGDFPKEDGSVEVYS